jgi:hypothetical protein
MYEMPGHFDAENARDQEAEDLLLALVARQVVQRRDGTYSVLAEDVRNGVIHIAPLRLIPDRLMALERLKRLLPELEAIALALDDAGFDHGVEWVSGTYAAMTGSELPPGWTPDSVEPWDPPDEPA